MQVFFIFSYQKFWHLKKPAFYDRYLLVRTILLPQNHFPVRCTVQKWIPKYRKLSKKRFFFLHMFWMSYIAKVDSWIEDFFKIYRKSALDLLPCHLLPCWPDKEEKEAKYCQKLHLFFLVCTNSWNRAA